MIYFGGEAGGTANSHTKYLRRQAEATLPTSALSILPSFPPYVSAHPFLTTVVADTAELVSLDIQVRRLC